MLSINEDRILEFLDGRLTPDAEEELLHTLAVSPERRQMLREHLKLRELTTTLSRQDRFTVPEHVTGSLFNQLTALGFTAPVSTAAILNNAPELIKASQKSSQRTEEQDAAIASTAASFFGKVRFSSVVTACVFSFLLGVGAFYVFGTELGLHTLAEERSLARLQHKAIASAQPVIHEQFDRSLANVQASLNSANNRPFDLHSRTPLVRDEALHGLRMSAVFPDRSEASIGSIAAAVLNESVGRPVAAQKQDENTFPAISFTAPQSFGFRPQLKSVGRGTSFYLAQPWHSEEAPIFDEKGTISFRMAGGRPPLNTRTQNWTYLSEVKFTWTLGDYLMARASLGQLMTWEQSPLYDKEVNLISTAPVQRIIAVAGGELGFTFDRFGVPLEVAGGVLADGAGNIYPRGGVHAHFDLFDLLSVGVGVEGVLYNRDISGGIDQEQKIYSGWSPGIASSSVKKETAGFIGPSIELGWHF